MTTIVVVKKDGRVAIGADSLTTFGDTRLGQAYEANRKILRVADSCVGVAGTSAHFSVLAGAFAALGAECRLDSKDAVFRTFLRLHALLKESYFLNTREQEDDPYESSQIMAVIANPSGIYGVYSYREVFAFERFWGIGSGGSFALGAMSAVYDQAIGARAIAEYGVRAGIEFDKNSSGPMEIIEIALSPSPLMEPDR
jgi:ATP-dependent protease HslVU (ClpYQ) peptidase subunit